MEEMIGLAAVVLIFGTPIAGIASYTYLKAKKLAASIPKVGMSEQETKLLEHLKEENAELKNRVSNLEEIVNSQPLLSDDIYLKSKKNIGRGGGSFDERNIVS
jgi:cell division protein FtsB